MSSKSAPTNPPQYSIEASKRDINRLGDYIFVGDIDKVKNLDDLYWSYVTEFCAAEDPYRPDSQYGDVEWCKRQMPYASFNGVGQFKMMARADQRAKERLAQLTDLLATNSKPTPSQSDGQRVFTKAEIRNKIYNISLTKINDIYYVSPGVDGSVGLSDEQIDQMLEAKDWLRGAESASDVRVGDALFKQAKSALIRYFGGEKTKTLDLWKGDILTGFIPKCSFCGTKRKVVGQLTRGVDAMNDNHLPRNWNYYCQKCYDEGMEMEREAMYG